MVGGGGQGSIFFFFGKWLSSCSTPFVKKEFPFSIELIGAFLDNMTVWALSSVTDLLLIPHWINVVFLFVFKQK